MAPRVLVFGATGQVAGELARADWGSRCDVRFLDRAAADFTAVDRLGPILHAARPDLAIIAAAYTAVDRAETDETRAHLVNADAPGAIAAAAAERGIPIVHLSTDYVFDGGKPGLYVEADATGPINAYGRTKLAGEERVRRENPRHLIIRTSWLYSTRGTNFLRTMLRLARTEREVRVVDDQWGCPTSARDLASAIARLAPRLLDPGAPSGTFHLAGATATTWHGFAERIFAELAIRGVGRPRNLPVATSAYPAPARRPMNSRLSSRRFENAFGFAIPGFERAAPAVLDDILAAA